MRRRLAALLVVALFLTALVADLLASDLPLALRADGRTYLLPCVTDPVELASFDQQSLRARAEWMLGTPVAYGPLAQHPGGITAPLEAPSRAHLLGTDDRGRDVLARLIHGTRPLVCIAALGTLVALALGLLLGLLAAAPRTQLVTGRLIEAGLAFPTLFLLLAIQGLRETTSAVEVALALGLTQWPHVARLVRAAALAQLASPHYEAARAVGASPARLLLVHVLPFAARPARVAASFAFAQALLFEAGLDFLGLGVPPPTASWGELLQQAQAAELAPWLLWPPSLGAALLVLATLALADDKSGAPPG